MLFKRSINCFCLVSNNFCSDGEDSEALTETVGSTLWIASFGDSDLFLIEPFSVTLLTGDRSGFETLMTKRKTKLHE